MNDVEVFDPIFDSQTSWILNTLQTIAQVFAQEKYIEIVCTTIYFAITIENRQKPMNMQKE